MLKPSKHIYQMRVRYAEVDPMDVAYHSRYFEWFEAARTEYLRSLGFAYRHLESDGVLLPVIEAHCRYRRPVAYDELIEVHTAVGEVSRLKIELCYEVFGKNTGTLRATGSNLHCYINREGRPIRAPEKLLNIFS